MGPAGIGQIGTVEHAHDGAFLVAREFDCNDTAEVAEAWITGIITIH
jgi:hypothetical protein